MAKQREVTVKLTFYGRGKSPVRVYRVSYPGVRGGTLGLNVVAATAESAAAKASRKLGIAQSRFSTQLIIKRGDFMAREFSAAMLR